MLIFPLFKKTCFDLQNALAMATDSKMAMMGMMMKALPRLLAISPKVTSSTGRVWLATLCLGIENGGNAGFGIPPLMSPVSVNVQSSLEMVGNFQLRTFLEKNNEKNSNLLA